MYVHKHNQCNCTLNALWWVGQKKNWWLIYWFVLTETKNSIAFKPSISSAFALARSFALHLSLSAPCFSSHPNLVHFCYNYQFRVSWMGYWFGWVLFTRLSSRCLHSIRPAENDLRKWGCRSKAIIIHHWSLNECVCTRAICWRPFNLSFCLA